MDTRNQCLSSLPSPRFVVCVGVGGWTFFESWNLRDTSDAMRFSHIALSQWIDHPHTSLRDFDVWFFKDKLSIGHSSASS